MNDHHVGQSTRVSDTDAVVEWTTTVQVPINIRRLAEIFCGMNDDQQAKFFVEAAAIMSAWGPSGIDGQCWYIGGHLRNCECSTEESRELIRAIANGMEHSNHGRKIDLAAVIDSALGEKK